GGRVRAVGDLVRTLGLAQPAVSKHLGVLRTVGLVSMAKDGQRRLYRLNAKGLKPVHDWVKNYEHFWEHQLDRIKARAEHKAKIRSSEPPKPDQEKGPCRQTSPAHRLRPST